MIAAVSVCPDGGAANSNCASIDVMKSKSSFSTTGEKKNTWQLFIFGKAGVVQGTNCAQIRITERIKEIAVIVRLLLSYEGLLTACR